MNWSRLDARGILMRRRQFLQYALVGLASYLLPDSAGSDAAYRVGVGRESDPYTATMRALSACGDWPPTTIAGRRVIIKTNLVVKATAETGIITDPQVVRAIVDTALAAGAAEVLIVEGEMGGENFSACGYDFFRDYDPAGRVSLVNLADQTTVLTDVPDGLAYRQLYMPELVLGDDVFLISAAKLKCHVETLVTLSMKNLFGLPPLSKYTNSPTQARFAIHERGVNQAIVDLNMVRPIDFAVVDGVWGLEGDGPWAGTPVQMDTVVAGRNALAVDLVCLQAMEVPQYRVQHLLYAVGKGLGPANAEDIEVRGDPLSSRPFLLPTIPPVIDYPRASPAILTPDLGQEAQITYWVNRPCTSRVEIVRLSETSPEVTMVRLLRDWALQPTGWNELVWDGRDDQGQIVSPGEYAIHVQATGGETAQNHAHATGWITVAESAMRRRGYLPLVSL